MPSDRQNLKVCFKHPDIFARCLDIVDRLIQIEGLTE